MLRRGGANTGKTSGILAAVALLAGLATAAPAAAQGRLTRCRLTYELRGWSFLWGVNPDFVFGSFKIERI